MYYIVNSLWIARTDFNDAKAWASLSPHFVGAKIRIDGELHSIPPHKLVLGDVIELSPKSFAYADMRVVSATARCSMLADGYVAGSLEIEEEATGDFLARCSYPRAGNPRLLVGVQYAFITFYVLV